MGIEPTEDDSHRPPPVLKTGPVTRSGRATAAEGNRFFPPAEKETSGATPARAQLESAAPVAGCVAVDPHHGMQPVASRRAQGAEDQRACDHRSGDGDGGKPGGDPVRPREGGDEQGEKDCETDREGD